MLYLRKYLEYVCLLFIRFNGVYSHVSCLLLCPLCHQNIQKSALRKLLTLLQNDILKYITWQEYILRTRWLNTMTHIKSVHNFHLMSSSFSVYFYSIIHILSNLLIKNGPWITLFSEIVDDVIMTSEKQFWACLQLSKWLSHPNTNLCQLSCF